MAKYECENCAYETDSVGDAAAHTLSAADGRHIMFAPSVLTVHEPVPGTVRDRNKVIRPAASAHHYPLSADCRCGSGRPIWCADSTADWAH